MFYRWFCSLNADKVPVHIGTSQLPMEKETSLRKPLEQKLYKTLFKFSEHSFWILEIFCGKALKLRYYTVAPLWTVSLIIGLLWIFLTLLFEFFSLYSVLPVKSNCLEKYTLYIFSIFCLLINVSKAIINICALLKFISIVWQTLKVIKTTLKGHPQQGWAQLQRGTNTKRNAIKTLGSFKHNGLQFPI